MHTLVLCNIGNSDLRADGKRPMNPRQDGERLWQTFEQHHFELPIIEHCLRFLLDQGQPVTRLALFYTDQPENSQTRAPDRYGVQLRDKDTLWFARIAERYLRQRFDTRIDDITLLRIEDAAGQSINPSLYDEAFDAYKYLIARVYSAKTGRCYVLMAGGIPACNTALQLHAISAYGEKCRFVYQPEGGEPFELRVGEQLLDTFRRATALEALKRRDFATAIRNVEGLNGPDPALLHLLRYAHYRESFDFDRAQQALTEGLRAASGELRNFLGTLKPDLERLIERTDTAALLVEIYENARTTFDNGRYADFLGRVFRFQEAALRHIVETRLGLATDLSPAKRKESLEQFVREIEANPHLKAFLDEAKINGQPLRYTDGPNREVLRRLLDFALADGRRADGSLYLNKAEQEHYGRVRSLLNSMDSLAQLRNQSIIAHGFAGVSREALNQAYRNEAHTILDNMLNVCQLIGLTREASPFDRIAEMAGDALRRPGS
ncbi:MAG: hypothetical protein SNJ69_13935 [Chloroflexaceae bacterium]